MTKYGHIKNDDKRQVMPVEEGPQAKMHWLSCFGWTCMVSVDSVYDPNRRRFSNLAASFETVVPSSFPSSCSSRVIVNSQLSSTIDGEDSLWIKDPAEIDFLRQSVLAVDDLLSPEREAAIRDSIIYIFDTLLEPQLSAAFKLLHDLHTMHRLARILVSDAFKQEKRSTITLERFSHYLFVECHDRDEMLFLLEISGRVGVYANFRADLWRLFWKQIILPFMIKHLKDSEVLNKCVALLHFTTKVSFCSFFQSQLDNKLILEEDLVIGVQLLIAELCSYDFEEESNSQTSTCAVYKCDPDSDDESEDFENSLLSDTVTL